MALGIEPNSIAPNLIAQSGKMLSENIRSIGQQVQGAILEINTRKDLARMGEEIMAGAVNPQSEAFAQEAIAFGFRHPLAIQDPRGQMALNILGKTHGEWQQGKQLEARINPYRSMAGGGIYNANTGEVTTSPTTKPVSVNRNARLTDPVTGEVIVEAEPLPEKGFNLSPGATRYDAQGNPIVTAPKPTGAAALTEYQSRTLALRQTAERRAAINEQVSSAERDIRALEQSLRSSKESSPEEKSKWQEQLVTLRDQRNRLLQDLNAPPTTEEITVEPELGAVPAGAAAPQGDGVVPPIGAVAPPASNTEFVLVFDPSGKPGRIRASQLESALANGYRRR